MSEKNCVCICFGSRTNEIIKNHVVIKLSNLSFKNVIFYKLQMLTMYLCDFNIFKYLYNNNLRKMLYYIFKLLNRVKKYLSTFVEKNQKYQTSTNYHKSTKTSASKTIAHILDL